MTGCDSKFAEKLQAYYLVSCFCSCTTVSTVIVTLVKEWMYTTAGMNSPRCAVMVVAAANTFLLPGGEGRGREPAAISSDGYWKGKEKKCGAALPLV